MSKIIFLPFLFSFCFTFAQNEINVYPSSWWVGMKNPHLQVLIHEKNIGSVSTNNIVLQKYPGVILESVQKVKNPNYLLLNLSIQPNAKSGKLEFSYWHHEY